MSGSDAPAMRGVVTAAELRTALQWEPLIDAIDDGHREVLARSERVLMHDGPNSYLVWHAWAPGSVIVTKMVTIIPGNPHGPAVQALVAVFDGVTGAPIGLIDGTELTYWKTAAVSAMATRYLARSDTDTLLMVGAGSLAPYLIAAHRSVRPSIKRVLVWNRTREKAEAVAQACGGEVAADLAEACASARLISCATASEVPLLCGEWLLPGTHVDLVGGFTPTMREADDVVVRRGRWFVDHRGTIHDVGDLIQPINDAVCTSEDILGDLQALACGTNPGRLTDDEITVFKSAGGAHLDLIAARHVLAVVPPLISPPR